MMSGLDDSLPGGLPGVLPDPPPSGPSLFGDQTPKAAVPYRVLARKYRPTTFDDLIGQEAMIRILRRAFEQGRIAHAWMLTGVRGVGKTTTARIIARALNCIGPDGQTSGPTASPCGICANCTAILADRHPDVIEMDAASNTGVDDVREVIDATRYRPLQARYKVFIIDEVHMLSRNAFNALLKTLEEPPPHVKFVFATTEIRKVPITVLSRCQRFDLRRISIAELTGLFTRIAEREHVSAEPAALDLIARAADGSARDGLSLLDQAIAQAGDNPVTTSDTADMLGLADRGSVFDLIEAVIAGQTEAALAITDRAHARGADLGVMLGDLLDLTHTLTRLKTVPGLTDGPDLPEMERVRGAALADRLGVPVLGRLWQMLLKGGQEVETASDRRAAAEMVLIRLCYTADLPTPGDLVRRLGDTSAPRPQLPQTPSPQTPSPHPSLSSSPPDGGGMRAVVGGSAMPQVQSAHTEPVRSVSAVPQPRNFREVAALVAHDQPVLHGHLLHSVHLVRFAPGMIELRPHSAAPRDLAASLGKLLLDQTGTRWTIALSQAEGEPTLAEQGQAADTARRDVAAEHPLVRAILDAFPGATIARVTDDRVDTYGLPPQSLADLVGDRPPETPFDPDTNPYPDMEDDA